jgi:hypothetical protein
MTQRLFQPSLAGNWAIEAPCPRGHASQAGGARARRLRALTGRPRLMVEPVQGEAFSP